MHNYTIVKINCAKDLELINFSDFNVVMVNVDKANRSILFDIEGGWSLKDSQRNMLGKGFLKISNYEVLYITSYNAKEDHEYIVEKYHLEALREINEIEIKDNEVIVKGFAKLTHNWLESGGWNIIRALTEMLPMNSV